MREHCFETPLDNIAPWSDMVSEAQDELNKMGARLICGDPLKGIPMILLDCRNVVASKKRMATAKAIFNVRRLDRIYGVAA